MDTHFLFRPRADQTSRGSDGNQDGRVSVATPPSISAVKAEGAAHESLRVRCLVSGRRGWDLLSPPTGELRTGGGQTGGRPQPEPPQQRLLLQRDVREDEDAGQSGSLREPDMKGPLMEPHLRRRSSPPSPPLPAWPPRLLRLRRIRRWRIHLTPVNHSGWSRRRS